MRGIKPTEYIEILNFIQIYHKFTGHRSNEMREHVKETYPKMNSDYGLNIKYVETSYDSRFAEIWRMTFRCLNGELDFRTNIFAEKPAFTEWKYNSVYELVMAFLKGELSEEEINVFKIEK